MVALDHETRKLAEEFQRINNRLSAVRLELERVDRDRVRLKRAWHRRARRSKRRNQLARRMKSHLKQHAKNSRNSKRPSRRVERGTLHAPGAARQLRRTASVHLG